MDKVRKVHNLVKRNLIQDVIKDSKNLYVLDVGCGRGGDLQKWQYCGVKELTMCDPDITSIQEAKNRSNNLGMSVNFFEGGIEVTPHKKYDIICYNFSIQYIFESSSLFFKTLKEIKKRLKRGGMLIGCIPDSEQILMHTPFEDSMGNIMVRKDNTGYGHFGEKLYVQLVDTPYYKNGPVSEPIAYKDLLITHLEHMNISLELWESFKTPYDISNMYSKFIFRKLS